MIKPSDPSEPPALKLFLDRSVQGRRFVEAVRLLVEDVETINDRYGVKPAEEILDQQWIADASADGRILIGADLRIRRNPLERQAVCRHAARYVVFGNNNMPPKVMIELFARHLPKIRMLTVELGPWVRRIAQGGDMDKVALNCADVDGGQPAG
jgi:hypothetical protein